MLPTKGYFQDIECPYLNSSCGRPYCHFRHRRKQVDQLEEIVTQAEKDTPVVPTYKPTPKSELANIHSIKSHIPISYVPDLTFRPERKSRPLPIIEKPTYKPTPLSILSSANKNRLSLLDENGEHIEAIKEIKQNIANVEYDPTISLQSASDIDFEDLSTEFDLIDEIINDKSKTESKSNDDNDAYDPSKTLVEIRSADNNKSDLPLESQVQDDGPSSHTTSDHVKEKNQEKLSNDREEARSRSKSETRTKSSKEHHKSSKSSKKEDKIHKKEPHKGSSKGKHSKEKSDATSDKSEKDPGNSSKHKIKPMNPSKSREKKEESKDKHIKEVKDDSKTKSRDKSDKSSEEKNSEKSRIKIEEKCKEISHDSKEKLKYKEIDREKHKSKEKTDRHKSGKSDKEKKHISESKEKKHGNREKQSSKDEQAKEKQHKSRKEEHKKHKNTSQSTGRLQKEKSRSKHKEKIENTKYSISESDDDDDDHAINNEFITSNNIGNMEVDTDLEEDEDETMMECYRIFNEYRPPQMESKENSPEKSEDVVSSSSDIYIPENVGKKRIAHPNSLRSQMYKEIVPPNQPKIINTPGQSLTNRYKLAKLAQANREQELLMNEINQNMTMKRPAPTLLEAARELKKRREIKREQQQQTPSTSLVDDILQGHSKSSQLKIPTKIAPAQNVMLMAKSKERISKIKPTVPLKTIAQTQKSGRVAHIPDVSLTDIPDVLEADKSKLPVNVRTRFLTMIADECVKLYISKDEAFTRALNEEYACYEKCKVLATYRNSAMLAVNRLRKEIQERNKTGLGLIGIGEDADRDSSSQHKGRKFYDQIKKWVLTDEELDIHGYPRESEEHHGKAVIRNFKRQVTSNLDDNQRMCCRCHKLYQVDDDGWPLFEEECCYHPMKKRTIRGEQTYLCCRSSDETGCATSDTHVSETANTAELDGFQTTMDPEYDNDTRNYAIYALDCEMCYTTKGLELTRVTVVDTECKTVYESLVKPFNPIIDYNTRFSGITKEQMDKTSTSILQVQANILHLCNSKTILIGHSLESDMKALKIVHENVIDTAVLFPHKMGLPHKRALKALASEYLRKIIQNDISGHDSAEDALTCMELLKWKLKNELKVKGS